MHVCQPAVVVFSILPPPVDQWNRVIGVKPLKGLCIGDPLIEKQLCSPTKGLKLHREPIKESNWIHNIYLIEIRNNELAVAHSRYFLSLQFFLSINILFQSPKSKSSRGKSAPKKSAPVKRQRTPAKKTGPPKKRAKKEVSDESESDADSEADEKVKFSSLMQQKKHF